jgi:hypothetical protein
MLKFKLRWSYHHRIAMNRRLFIAESSQEPKLIAGSLDFSEAECFFCFFVVI